METAPLKSFATWARTALIREVNARIVAVLAAASKDRVESSGAVAALERDIAAAGDGDKGRDAVADKVAYTWFNRIIALRFMDANGYTGIGIVSPPRGQTTGQPEVLADAKRGSIDSAVANKRTIEAITALLDGTRRSDDPQGETYALLLAEYCRHWNRSMPFMFERAGDYTELLIPANLLADGSVLARAVTVLTEDVCQDVEVIGWLYQFYISERKDEVFAGFKNNKKAGATEIPAATQLFTPHWIVRYLVENSLGRLWLLNHPESKLAAQMEYYVDPVDQETEFLRIGSPEELKIIDPAVGSGHMLTYAFDLLYAIYDEVGYAPSEIAGLILKHNLYGTEIDPRAGALAAFALTMKATSRRKNFLRSPVQPNICVLEPIRFDQTELDYLWSLTKEAPISRAAADAFWSSFEYADMFGSLIQPNPIALAALSAAIDGADTGDLVATESIAKADRVVRQASELSRSYAVLVANPPYMGTANMGATLAEFTRANYPLGSPDLMTCFMERAITLTSIGGVWAMIDIPTWMSVKSFEGLRRDLLQKVRIESLLHLGRGLFGADFGTVAFFFTNLPPTKHSRGIYRRLFDEHVQVRASSTIERLFLDPERGRFVVRQVDLLSIPRTPIAYWMGDAERAVFGLAPALGEVARTGNGLTTGDNDRFLRYWWEVSESAIDRTRLSSAESSSHRWAQLNKGGANRRWAGNQEYVIDWANSGESIKNERPKATVRNEALYFRETIAWSDVTSGGASFRYFPPGNIFDASANAFFPETVEVRLGLLSVCNSAFNRWILERLSPGLHFKIGDVAVLPYLLRSDNGWQIEVAELIDLAQRDWDSVETSPGFRSLTAAHSTGVNGRLRDTLTAYQAELCERVARVRELESNNNRQIALAYGLDDKYASEPGSDEVTLSRNPWARGSNGATDGAIAADLVSYAVGCMFGRYSLDRPGTILANPRDTLQEYLASRPSPAFTPDFDNVIPIVDGDWFEDDIVARFRQFLRVAFGEEHFAENLKFMTESLEVKDLRDYFVKSFYKDHVRRYKKRPIFWLFSSPSGSFSALVYLHRYTPLTAAVVLNEYLREFRVKLDASRQHHERLAIASAVAREKAAAEKEVDRLRTVILELDEYEHDVLYPLATRQIAIDLDDGILANYLRFGDALRIVPEMEKRRREVEGWKWLKHPLQPQSEERL